MFTDTLNKVTQGMTSHTTTKPTGVVGLPSVSNEIDLSIMIYGDHYGLLAVSRSLLTADCQ